MPDEAVAGVGSNQYVALKLLEAIAQSEEKASLSVDGVLVFNHTADKDWILHTYAECLLTVENPVNRVDAAKS